MNTGKLIGQGNTAEIFALGEDRILKLFREGIDRATIEREYTNSVIAMEVLDNVPKVYSLEEADGRHGIVYEKINGREQMMLMIEDPEHIEEYSKEFARIHYSIAVPVEGEMRTVKDKLKNEILWERDLTDVEKAKIVDMLADLPDGDKLCHNDFHPGNIMLTEKGAKILDWMTGAKGDECADAARTVLLLRYGELLHASEEERKKLKQLMKSIYEVYIKEYTALSGRSIEDIRAWEIPVAAARLNEWLTDNERENLLRFIRDGIK